jgi:hypothetical protein
MSSHKNGTGQPELNQGTPALETPAAEQKIQDAVPAEGTPPSRDGEQEDDKKNNAAPEQKIGLAAFIQLSGVNKYMEAMLRSNKAMEVHTKSEWEEVVTDLLKKKVK